MLNKNHFSIFLLLLNFSFSYCSEQPETIKKLFESYIDKVDSVFQSTCTQSEIRMKEVSPADDLFKKLLLKHSFFLWCARTNSRGVLVNELRRPAEQGG